MAVHDAEINIGVNLDADQFQSSFKKTILQTSQDTQTHLQGILDDLKGSAARDWQTLPFTAMHDLHTGHVVASQAFVSSMSEDLKRQGINPGTLGYQSALLSAAMRSSTPNPMDRYHRMLAEGMYYQADEMHPSTALSRAVDTNYALMEQDWSKDFMVNMRDRLQQLTVTDLRAQAKAQNIKGRSRMHKADLIKALIQNSDTPEMFVDFAGMREFAVEHGLGRWVDPEGEHTASNFELINNELEKIGKSSDASKKNFEGWGEALKGALGTLTLIGGAVAKVVGATVGTVVAVNKMSEKETVAGAKHLDARRALIGMSALDQLKTKVAGRSVSLGEDAIYSEILGMAENIQQYKLLGQGDALPPALLGVFDNLMNSDKPFEAYKSAADEIYNNLKGQTPEEQQRTLMLMDKAGLGSMSMLVGQFLSNSKFAQAYGAPSSLFDLRQNPYYGSFETAEGIVPDLVELNESIKASYTQLATDWQESFGIPFKEWWDSLLKDTLVPWADKLEKLLGRSVRTALGKATDADEAKTNIKAIRDVFASFGGDSSRMKAIEAGSGNIANTQAGTGEFKYTKGSTWGDFLKGGGYTWRANIFTDSIGDTVQAWVPSRKDNLDFTTEDGKVTNAYWNGIVKAATYYSDEQIAGLKYSTDRETMSRLKKMYARLEETGLSGFLENTKYEDMDKYLIRGITMGLYDSDDWEANFEAMINSALRTSLDSPVDDEIVKILREIAGNTAVANLMYNDPELMTMFRNRYPEFYANRMMEQLHFGTESSDAAQR